MYRLPGRAVVGCLVWGLADRKSTEKKYLILILVDVDNKYIFIPNLFEYIYACGGGRMGGCFPGGPAVWWWAGDLWSVADRARKKKKRNIHSLYDSVNDGGWDGGRALRSMYTLRTPPGQRPEGICWTDMVGRVVGGDSQGGWTRPRANSPWPLLLLSSPMEERERERESLVYAFFFFALYTSMRAAKWQSFRGRCNFFSFHIRTHCICN